MTTFSLFQMIFNSSLENKGLLCGTWLLNLLKTKYEHELFHYNLLFYICLLRKYLHTHSG